MIDDAQDLITEGETIASEAEAAEKGSKIKFNEIQLVSFVRNRFQQAKDARTATEDIWSRAYKAYRGEYTAEQKAAIAAAEARNPGASKVYIKVTKTKVQAAYGQILEILFSGGRFPISVESTPIPEGTPESVHIESKTSTNKPQEPQDIYGYKDDGEELEPGATAKSLFSKLSTKYRKLLGEDAEDSVKKGTSLDPAGITIHPAEESARAMQKLINDQLTEANARRHLDSCALECTVYGTGVMKGPFNYNETVNKWEQDLDTKKITYVPYKKLVPKTSFVSCWNFYPDPEAVCLDDAEFVIERHLMARSQLRDLTNMPLFNKANILKVLKSSPSRSREDWEDSLRDNSFSPDQERYEVLEYWGTLDVDLAEALGLDLDSYDAEFLDVVQVNIWVCNNEVLRLVLNPFTPKRIPYFAVPYEKSLHQIWGVGVPENMEDTQMLMNGHMRMSIDNLRLAGNVMLEVNEQQLVPGQDMTVYPGKIWRKQGGAPGQTIFGFTIPNTSQSHIMMFDKARQLADEAVGLPSFSHGQTGVTGVGRTAAGISMLMGAAAGAIKTVISNFDRYLLEPLGESLFQWNMQFNEDNCDIRGDLKIAASGSKSLMQKEVLTQRLMTFLQIAGGNPATAPMVNLEYIIKQIAISMSLDPEKAVNDLTTAKLYADIMSKMNGNQQGPGKEANSPIAPQGGAQPPVPGTNPADSSGGGGGNIGVGSAPVPGEAGFSSAA